MIKTVPILLLFLIGCSHTSSTAVIDGSNNRPIKIFTQQCGDNEINVLSDDLLFRKGHLYFFLFLPIGPSSYLNTGPTIYVDYGFTKETCSIQDVSVKIANQTVDPTTATYTDKYSCRYSWDEWNLSPDNSEELTLTIKNVDVCEIPPIDIKYQYDSEYNYDSMCC